ncbi:MAG TPA: FAD-binding oxidoreductase [Gaiellaceae bacterium]
MTTQPRELHGLRIAARDGSVVSLPASDLEALASRVQGRLLVEGDAGWDEAILVWNGMAAKTPALVVQPTSAEDVGEIVSFARERGLLLSVKGGGHHVAGIAIAEGGLTLDLSQLREIEVDPEARLARVGAGCQLADVDRATQEHGLATPLGFISEVGVAGLTLGGGLGYLTRRFGWTVDYLEEVEIVAADGRVRTASRRQHEDLFWAVRGGGGNVGVVTRFTYRLHDVGPMIHGGLIGWPVERADEILRAYRTITAGAPRELTLWLVMLHAPPLPFVPDEWHGQKLCTMVVCWSGDLAEADAALAPIRAIGDPVVDVLQPWPYVQQQSFLDDGEPKGMHYYWKTEFVSELGDGLLDATRDTFVECPVPGAMVGFLQLHGALNERASDDGAVGNRDVRFALGVLGKWEPDEPRADAFVQWVRDGWERVSPFTLGRTYVNFQSADEDDARVRAAYGENYERLAAVKARYDPENLFRVNRNVRPRSRQEG